MPLFPSLPQIPDAYLGSDALELSIANGAGTLTANQVYLLAVVVRVTETITGMRWHMTATATGHTDLGIYNSSGALIDHTGATANVAGSTMTQALSNGNLSLSPGLYYIALTNDNGTDTYSKGSSLTAPGAVSGARQATNAATGVLPATLGALLPPTGGWPLWCGMVQGGLP